MTNEAVPPVVKDSEKLLDKALSVGHVVSQLAFVLSEPVNDLTRQCTPKQTSQALINSFMGMCKRNSPSIWTIPFKENLSTEEDVQVNKLVHKFNQKLSTAEKVSNASLMKVLNLSGVKQILFGFICKLYGYENNNPFALSSLKKLLAAKIGRAASIEIFLDNFGQDIVDGYIEQRKADPKWKYPLVLLPERLTDFPFAPNLTTTKADKIQPDDTFLDKEVMKNQEGKSVQHVTMQDISVKMAGLSSTEQIEILCNYKDCLEGEDDRLVKTRETIKSTLDAVRSVLDRTTSRNSWRETLTPFAKKFCENDTDASNLRIRLCRLFDAARTQPLNEFLDNLRFDLVKLRTSSVRPILEPSTMPTTTASSAVAATAAATMEANSVQNADEVSHLPLDICTPDLTVAQLEQRRLHLEGELVKLKENKQVVIEEQEQLIMTRVIRTTSTASTSDNNTTTNTSMATTEVSLSADDDGNSDDDDDDEDDDDDDSDSDLEKNDGVSAASTSLDISPDNNVAADGAALVVTSNISPISLDNSGAALQSTLNSDLEVSDSGEEDDADETDKSEISSAFLAEMATGVAENQVSDEDGIQDK
ncbi:hypothetical protein Fcan01_18087 [Folsomia candida]|uniref:Uncharacterized protein n=1 Tax=Folsomia candida TaxID=158441 RepID=A0A226DND1_FOLCA|nr:hypothetical protein Fcan01_18087 [Folsomia candida]